MHNFLNASHSASKYIFKGKNASEITAFAVDEINGDLLYYDAGRGVFVVWNNIELQFSEGNGYNKGMIRN